MLTPKNTALSIGDQRGKRIGNKVSFSKDLMKGYALAESRNLLDIQDNPNQPPWTFKFPVFSMCLLCNQKSRLVRSSFTVAWAWTMELWFRLVGSSFINGKGGGFPKRSRPFSF